MSALPSPSFPSESLVVRAPADRPLSALLAILVLVATWALLLVLVQSSAGHEDRLSAHADPAAAEARP